ncbi:hypothetical protein C0995_000119 [Termitomyces sp. Mi166|nr:hypothetical protein C0995_000119 [Termitomyces sp. Mi166\
MESKSILVTPHRSYRFDVGAYITDCVESLFDTSLAGSDYVSAHSSVQGHCLSSIECRGFKVPHRYSGLFQRGSAGAGCKDTSMYANIYLSLFGSLMLHLAVVTLMSVLSAVATGFWSRLGDVHGRKPVFALFLLGAICIFSEKTTRELAYVLVMQPDSLFGHHAEKFILAGPILEGLVGDIPLTAQDMDHDQGYSPQYKALFLLAWLRDHGGLVLPKTTILDVEGAFALSISLLLAVLFYVLLICPESREPTAPEDETYNRETPLFIRDPVAVIRSYTVRFVKALVIPITMFAPRAVPGRPGRSYNLTLVGMALFLYLVSIVLRIFVLTGIDAHRNLQGVYSAKYLYAQHVYSWTTAELGYYMSILWITRAFNLLVFLPIVISYFKPKSSGTSPDAIHLAAELHFDKRLAQASLAVDGLADALVALTPASSQTLFIGLSCLSSFTSGGNPTLHSLGAICLHACGFSSEVGALFGGMAVLSAIAHIINPYIYALTYSSTVAYFPKAIFVLATALLSSAVLLLTGVSSRTEDVIIHERSSGDDEYSSGNGSAS